MNAREKLCVLTKIKQQQQQQIAAHKHTPEGERVAHRQKKKKRSS